MALQQISDRLYQLQQQTSWSGRPGRRVQRWTIVHNLYSTRCLTGSQWRSRNRDVTWRITVGPTQFSVTRTCVHRTQRAVRQYVLEARRRLRRLWRSVQSWPLSTRTSRRRGQLTSTYDYVPLWRQVAQAAGSARESSTRRLLTNFSSTSLTSPRHMKSTITSYCDMTVWTWCNQLSSAGVSK